MKTKITRPTDEFYGQLQQAYDYFNEKLFGNALPHCLITVQREKNTMGFFSPVRWSNDATKDVHEIALNPAYFANRKLVEIFQTLVHEQCHLWQHEFGAPSRVGYHNWEWSAKMESLGLMPSSTGEPGGNRVGQKMSDYMLDNGPFKQACLDLIISGYQFKWVDRRTAEQDGLDTVLLPPSTEIIIPASLTSTAEDILHVSMAELIPNFQYQISTSTLQRSKSKTKYQCPGCSTNVWGKPNLCIRCETCNELFQPE